MRKTKAFFAFFDSTEETLRPIMAPQVSSLSLCALFLVFVNLTSLLVSATEIVYEDGYTVTTVIDGNIVKINPHSVLPQSGSSDLLILDSPSSALYSASFYPGQDVAIKLLSGHGEGYSDGDLGSAMFDKPKSFAVDFGGNVYVADKGNRVIRKISKSGVTTIAGSNSTKYGRADGSGRDASFSSDFELAFIPDRCALMICDHGNRLVRQIKLKSQDCSRGSQPVLGMSAWPWVLGVASCLLGLIIGFAVRPFIASHPCRPGRSSVLRFNETWKQYPMSWRRQILMLCFGIRSAIVRSTPYKVLRGFIMLSLSQLSLMCRINTVKPQTLHEKPVSLLDSELLVSNETIKSQMIADQLKDLITFDGGVELPESAGPIFGQRYDYKEGNDVFSDSHRRIDYMIQANFTGFAEEAKQVPLEESFASSLGLVKRR